MYITSTPEFGCDRSWREEAAKLSGSCDRRHTPISRFRRPVSIVHISVEFDGVRFSLGGCTVQLGRFLSYLNTLLSPPFSSFGSSQSPDFCLITFAPGRKPALSQVLLYWIRNPAPPKFREQSQHSNQPHHHQLSSSPPTSRTFAQLNSGIQIHHNH